MKIVKYLVLDLASISAKKLRMTIIGGIFLTKVRGKTEKSIEMAIPINNPLKTLDQIISKLTSTGRIDSNRIGTAYWIPIPIKTPTILPRIPRNTDWIKKILNACQPLAPIHLSTATACFFCCT